MYAYCILFGVHTTPFRDDNNTNCFADFGFGVSHVTLFLQLCVLHFFPLWATRKPTIDSMHIAIHNYY